MKVIKEPTGKAREYAARSVSLYRRCNNGCVYCYNNRGVVSKTLGAGAPELLSGFDSEDAAYAEFCREVDIMRDDLRLHGLFFTFISDPCLPETIDLSMKCAEYAMDNRIPVTFLTKRADFISSPIDVYPFVKMVSTRLMCIGFTLTGHDSLEPMASPNAERISALHLLHGFGIRTMASIEPVISFEASLRMICESLGGVDVYKVGLMSGKKSGGESLAWFVRSVMNAVEGYPQVRVYWKKSVRDGLDESMLSWLDGHPQCVGMDYDMFNVNIRKEE